MPITPYLNGEQFYPESIRILGVTFGLVCIALQVEGSGDDVKQAIANKVIQFAKAGPICCARVLEGHPPADKRLTIWRCSKANISEPCCCAPP